ARLRRESPLRSAAGSEEVGLRRSDSGGETRYRRNSRSGNARSQSRSGARDIGCRDRQAARTDGCRLAEQIRHHPGGEKKRSGPGRDVPLMPGDVIISINNHLTVTLDGLREELKKLNKLDPAVLQIERDGKLMYLSFYLDK